MLKSLIYRCAPNRLVNTLRHYKHLHDLATVSEPDFVHIRHLIHLGDRVLDVGANFGVFTKFFSEAVGPTGQVFSFEPIPTTFRTLSKAVERYKLTNVRAMNVAVSDRNRVATMQIPRLSEGGDNLYEAEITATPNAGWRTFEVKTITLDSLNLPRVDFIKIDVEGHEVEVLNGACNLLMRHRPALLIEVNHREVRSMLSSLGYQEPMSITRPNKLFIAPSHLKLVASPK